jgi:hypothetical protein
MSGVEKSVFLKKLIKEAVIEALMDKELLGKIMQGVVDYTIEQQTSIMESMKKTIVRELAGSNNRQNLNEGNDNRQRTNPNNNPANQKVAAISKKLFKGKNVFDGVAPEREMIAPTGLAGMFQNMNFKDVGEDDPNALMEEFSREQLKRNNFTPRQPAPEPVQQRPAQQSSEPKKPRFVRPPEDEIDYSQEYVQPPQYQQQMPQQRQRQQSSLIQESNYYDPNAFARPQVEAGGLFDPSEIAGGFGFVQPNVPRGNPQNQNPYPQNPQNQNPYGGDFNNEPQYEPEGDDFEINSFINSLSPPEYNGQ